MDSEVPGRPLAPMEVPLVSYDMWGAGCVLAELVTMKHLKGDWLQHAGALAGDAAVMQAVLKDVRKAYEGAFGSLAAHLLAVDPDHRLSAPEMVAFLRHIVVPPNPKLTDILLKPWTLRTM